MPKASPQEDVWAFRTRPDLRPPAVVTTQVHDAAPGYNFVTPEGGGARQGGSMIVDDRGEVVWRLGGKKSDFEMGPNTRFTFQRDARRLPEGTISIFDNGTTVFRGARPEAVEESRGIVLELDERKMRASLVREYIHPEGQHADAGGNMQVLPNSNVFVGWGRAMAFSEFGEDGSTPDCLTPIDPTEPSASREAIDPGGPDQPDLGRAGTPSTSTSATTRP